MKYFIVCVLLCLFVGCGQQAMEPFTQFMESATDLARAGNVSGTLRGRLGEGFEAGAKEAVYLINSGSYLELNINYRFADNVTRKQE